MPVDTVLIIDHDPDELAKLGARLIRSGYKVVDAADASTAFQKLESTHVGAIVGRALMPQVSGYEFCRALRNIERFAKIPVFLFSGGDIAKEAEAEARAAGAYKIVPQGTDFSGIVDALSGGLADPDSGTSDSEAAQLAEICSDFISEAKRQIGEYVARSESRIELDSLAGFSHRLSGAGKMLGFEQIGSAAAELEALVSGPGAGDRQAILPALRKLRDLIHLEGDAESPPARVTPAVRRALAGKRFGLVNFARDESSRISRLLDETDAFARVLEPFDAGKPDTLEALDVLIVSAGGEPQKRLDAPEILAPFARKPQLIVGTADSIGIWVAHEARREFILRPWDDAEFFFRCFHLVSGIPAAPATGAVQDAPFARPRVLLVDDDPIVISLVRMTLESYRIECHTADRGGLVFDTALRIRPNAIVLDINMPELDGFAVLTRLKQSDSTRSIPVVMLTAMRQEKDIIRGFALGADDYVVKPFNPIELAARLRRLFRSSTTQ